MRARCASVSTSEAATSHLSSIRLSPGPATGRKRCDMSRVSDVRRHAWFDDAFGQIRQFLHGED